MYDFCNIEMFLHYTGIWAVCIKRIFGGMDSINLHFPEMTCLIRDSLSKRNNRGEEIKQFSGCIMSVQKVPISSWTIAFTHIYSHRSEHLRRSMHALLLILMFYCVNVSCHCTFALFQGACWLNCTLKWQNTNTFEWVMMVTLPVQLLPWVGVYHLLSVSYLICCAFHIV